LRLKADIKMMPQGSQMARKRKYSSLDSDSPSMDHGSPLRRKSPRIPLSPLKPSKLNQKESYPLSPSKRSPQKSPSKPTSPTMVTGSFYGKKKPLYLTPLERKLLKETKSPPRMLPSAKMALEDPYSLPGVPKKMVKNKAKRITTTVTVTKQTESKKTSAIGFSKTTDTAKTITLTFGGLKPKPKIFVGAAFFGTGKKPSSMFKALPKTPKPAISKTHKPMMTSTPRSTDPSLNTKKSGKAVIVTPERKEDETTKTTPTECLREKRSSAKVAETRIAAMENLDNPDDDEVPETPEDMPLPPSPTPPTAQDDLAADDDGFASGPGGSLSSSPRMYRGSVGSSPDMALTPRLLALKYGMTKEIRVLLDRSPTPTTAGPLADINTQEDFITEPDCQVVPSSNPNSSPGMYPIFGSQRPQRKCVQPLPCSALSNTPDSPSQLRSQEHLNKRVYKRKDKKRPQGDDQLIIDAGQKQFGATTCSFCGMIYSVDSSEDNFQHTLFHQKLMESIKFVGWKKERVVAEFWDGKIILVLPDDPKYAVRKAEEVRQLADNELGFQQTQLSSPRQAKTYLFVNQDRMIVGCLIAEHIKQAFRVLAQPEVAKDMNREDFMEHHRTWVCSVVPETAHCGISRIWVLSQARRKGVATRMLDTLRNSFTYGSPLTKEDLAFSDPTPDGRLFAARYSETQTFLVYNFVG